MEQVWPIILEEIRNNVSEMAFKTWFEKLRLLSFDEGVVVFGLPSAFFVTQFERKYNDVVVGALKAADLEDMRVRYIIESSDINVGRRKPVSREVSAETDVCNSVENMRKPLSVSYVNTVCDSVDSVVEKSSIGRDENVGNMTNSRMNRVVKLPNRTSVSSTKVYANGLNPKYRFENLVVGPNNDLAVSAARAVVENPGTRYNPYFIYGGAGFGKTHLVQAIGNEILAKNPDFKILYVTIEQFYHSFVEAMKNKTGGAFAEKFRNVDVLIIDDFQMIIGKEKSQEEFFNTFNTLYQNNKQVIVTSDRQPSEIATIDVRLASRLMSGMPIDIQFPEFEVRCAILKAKAEFEGKDISNRAVEFIAENVRTNIRELEGKYNQLVAFSELRGISPDEVIEEGYMNDIAASCIQNISSKKLIEKIAKFFGVKVSEILSATRAQHISLPRQVAMFLLSEELGMSTTKIALELGRKDHTTAMHGIRKIRSLLETDVMLRDKIASFRRNLYD